MKRVIMVGADLEIVELIQESKDFELVGIVDNKLEVDYYGIPIIGNDDEVYSIKKKYGDARVVITLDDVWTKRILHSVYREAGFEFETLVSKHAYFSPLANENKGVIIQKGANIGPNVKIGICTKVNVGANIMHDGFIGNFCTIAPNAITLGYVKIGDNVFLGANATVLPKVHIENDVIVGAGAVVTKKLGRNGIYVGNPARLLRSIKI